jgi:SAM-dependent methyltransferase
MALFGRREDPHALAVRMTGVQKSDRVLLIGCEHGSRLASVAARVGLAGRAVAIVFDQVSADRVRKGSESVGVLIDIMPISSTTLPIEDAAFDFVLVDDTNGLLGSLKPEDRVTLFREMHRALRAGGRAMVMSGGTRSGLAALLSRSQSGEPFDPLPSLEADGFKGGRRLAEREGLVFFEAMKPRV